MKELLRKAGKNAAVAGLKAVEKTVPVAANVAVKTGEVAFKAGSGAIAEYKHRRAEKEQSLIDGLKKKYPGSLILISRFNPDNEDLGGSKSTIRKITAYDIYDEYFALQYSAEGIIDIEYGRRRLHLYDQKHKKIGSCTEHGVFQTILSIESDGDHVMDIKYQRRQYEFSDLRYEYMKEKSSKGILVGRAGMVLMEIQRIKGHEVIAVVDPSRAVASMLIYIAIKLPKIPRPSSAGGG